MVVRDVVTGDELARADHGRGIQSVLVPCPGPSGDFYICTFLGASRVTVAG